MKEKSGKNLGKDLNENRAIIEKLDNAPFTIREKNGRYYARVSFCSEDGEKQKEFAMGHSLELTKLLVFWQDIEKVKSGELTIDSLNKWGKQKIKRSPLIQESINQDSISIGEAIALFTNDFWNERSFDNLKAQTTWKGYCQVVCKIPQVCLSESVSIENLTKLITDNSPPETRKREKWVLVCGILAKLAGIQDAAAIKKLKGNRQTQPLAHYIPSDDEIVAVRDSIKDPAWQWVFGMLAVYGLRPSELFHLDFDSISEKIILIGSNTKTGGRMVFPLHKQWFEDWHLERMNYPDILIPEKLVHLTNGDKSHKISQKFSRSLKLNFPPYALRDAYAIRGAVLGISPSVISQWMGHSLTVHYNNYQKYISKREWFKIWEDLD